MFLVGYGQKHVPTRVRVVNKEIFYFLDLLKCCFNTKLQHYYVGDGVGDAAGAGLGLPPMVLTDRAVPRAKILFKHNLHEVKGLVESKVYLNWLKQLPIDIKRQ